MPLINSALLENLCMQSITRLRFFPLLGLAVSAALFTVLLIDLPAGAAQLMDRYFLMGSGELHLFNHRNGREATVRLRQPNGSINNAALAVVDRVFAYPGTTSDHISPRMLFALSSFVDQVAPGKTVQIESAYRSPEYNDSIRKQGANAARTSTHLDGLALDFWIDGVDGKGLWQMIRERNCCGVGHYGGKTIHFDAGRPRFWEAATSGTKSPEPDHNRHLYLSTEYDRYLRGETVKLMLSGIATYGFGLRPTVEIVSDTEPRQPLGRVRLASAPNTDCRSIPDRTVARAMAAPLSTELPPGRYRLRLGFCNKPFTQMPDEIISNPIELVQEP